MKHKQLLKLGMIAFIIAGLVGCNKTVTIDTSQKNIDVDLTDVKSNDSKDPYENFYSFHFSLNGDDLKLHMTYDELYKLGWQCELKPEERYLPHKYLKFKKGEASFVGFLLTSDDYFQRAGDAILSQVYLKANTPSLIAKLPKGVNIDKTTKDELIQLVGEPSEDFEHPEDDSTYFIYEYDKNQDITIIIDNKTNKVSEVQIYNEYVDSTLLEVPDVVNNYKAPTKLSRQLDSQEFSLDGQVYKAPVPIQVFLDHGWKLKYHEDAFYQKGDLIGYRSTEAILLEKGDQEFEIEYENLIHGKQPIEKCIAVTITFSPEKKLNQLLFPQGISLHSKPKDILETLNQYQYQKEVNKEMTIYYIFLNDYSHFELTTNKEETKLESLYLCHYPHLKK